MFMIDRRRLGVTLTATLAATGAVAASKTTVSAAPPPVVRFPQPTEAVPVAVVLDEGATIIDFGGPWETFQDVEPAANVPGFRMYTVARSREALRSQGGLHILPDFTFADAPRPRVVLIPAELGSSQPEKLAWIREMSKTADIVMSVCSGAFILANTGLLDGLSATTHHLQYEQFAKAYRKVRTVRDRRFVDNGKFVTAGGLTSSIDGALHIVARFYGVEAAEKTAQRMEHDGDGWRSGVRVHTA